MKKQKSKFRNIVVSGDIGTGTTTLSKSLAEKLGWSHIVAGDFFRDYAKKNDIPLWNKSAVPDDLDKFLDEEFYEKMKNNSNIVFDSHYGGWFSRNLEDVFRILLVCDEKVATKRILERKHTHTEAAKEIEKRRRGLRAKFKKLYSDDDYEDPKFFHLILDTTETDEKETTDKVLKALED